MKVWAGELMSCVKFSKRIKCEKRSMLALVCEQVQQLMGRTCKGRTREETQKTEVTRKPKEGEDLNQGACQSLTCCLEFGDSAVPRSFYPRGRELFVFICIY